MKASINIHPPKNWQDFETLCLKLWGEIWNIPHEIDLIPIIHKGRME
ncbi:hypothetical protein J2T04_001186 [Chryseobacterium lathyri]|uniref:Uncharacterized protein n=1 Tax=Chryseobacterium lathyri TaxID=395933 RepID=A0ABT9SK00_9FLAO|nr:hypothetical protein [Chryseobacterium lathyri]